MKGLISLTLAASLLGSVSAFAQSDNTPSAISRISGQKFYAADGSSLTFFVYAGGLAREIHTPDGSALVEVFAFKSGDGGTVSESEDTSAVAGKFQFTGDGLATEYNDGRVELLTQSGEALSMMTNSPEAGKVCTAWYPEGHRFSDTERRAAIFEVTDKLGLDEQDAAEAAVKHSCDAPLGSTREASATAPADEFAARTP
ncbi:MAG TPA: hypothetical protein VKB71_18995 [Rhizomicrobium sp.]|nr:hypothetical protein [Rhizomicrobium sp.]